jgi:hypothetical protein
LRFLPSYRLLSGLALAATAGVHAGALAAQEYCVACTEPAAVYRCVVDGAKPGGSQPLQVLCITAMAKEGKHATCGVKGGTVFDCDGPVKRVPWAAYNEPGPGQEPAAPAAAKSATKPADKDPNAPPQTVQEMARRANEKTAEQAKALGNATQKTWRCIASLFTRCGD